ncbi:TPA: hypothetical protein ACGOTA_000948, partial [Streptococcus suis]
KAFASKNQGSDSERLEMKQKAFASKSQGSDSERLEMKQQVFASKMGKNFILNENQKQTSSKGLGNLWKLEIERT